MAPTLRNNALGLQVPSHLLEPLCKSFTQSLLLCLPQVNKVTFYFVGSLPHLKITRLGMADRNRETSAIQWCASSQADCDLSGKYWKDVRDCSTYVQNAFRHCLQNQSSWTSSGSKDDFCNGVEKSSEKMSEKHCHFQPVMLRKADLWHSMPPPSVYPRDRDGEPIWFNSDHVTVALLIINLAFESHPFDQNYWQITEWLTGTLEHQLLYLHSKESFSYQIELLTEEKEELKIVLINQIRQAMVKLSLVNRVVDNEIADLRQSWENLVHKYHPEQPSKNNILKQLNQLLEQLTEDLHVHANSETAKELSWYQHTMADYSFLPEENEVWFQKKILPLWRDTTSKLNQTPELKGQVQKLLDKLEQSFYVGSNKKFINKIDSIPKSIKSKWINLAYNGKGLTKNDLLEDYTYILENIKIDLFSRRNKLESLACLKMLASYLQKLEINLNEYIIKYGNNNQIDKSNLH